MYEIVDPRIENQLALLTEPDAEALVAAPAEVPERSEQEMDEVTARIFARANQKRLKLEADAHRKMGNLTRGEMRALDALGQPRLVWDSKRQGQAYSEKGAAKRRDQRASLGEFYSPRAYRKYRKLRKRAVGLAEQIEGRNLIGESTPEVQQADVTQPTEVQKL